ncbi:MAG: LytR C-terminal domain-containing protein [Candidatus Levybacteria bacterium]|nr:LytR C-terminal domain-containing protein [Candidatus Levybacteria bacterium]MBI2420565.1 LytR C-terminal domain-containing protein [Candidatus Levybacteria bacterium]
MEGLGYQDASSIKKTSNRKRIILLLVFAVLVIIFLISLVRFFSSPKQNEEVIPTPTPSESSSAEITKEPTPTSASADSDLGRGNLSLTIQNGSGESGVAQKVSDLLEKKGYTVSTTGNADNFEYQNVTIQIKKSEEEFLSLLEDDLSEEYKIGSTSADLSSSFSTDALIIIGK